MNYVDLYIFQLQQLIRRVRVIHIKYCTRGRVNWQFVFFVTPYRIEAFETY